MFSFITNIVFYFIPIPMSICNRIGAAMVGVLASSVVDNGF